MEKARLSELMRKITPYYDKQLSSQDEQTFLKEIKDHPASQSAFEKERVIREKLRNNLHRPAHSEQLVNQILIKIQNEGSNKP